MAKKQMLFKTKGMNRDLSVSAFNPEFAFENMNLRLSTNESNTLMSWVNEKGTAVIPIYDGIEYWSKEGQPDVYVDPQDPSYTYHPLGHSFPINGVPIGTAVINNTLVLFTTYEVVSGGQVTTHIDRIYKIKYSDDKTYMLGKTLYGGDLNFSTEHPLETLVSYESKDIQKVYWTDHFNQPRLINIENVRFSRGYDSQFDFIVELDLNEEVKVMKILGANGMFAPGVIQYAFTYYNNHGQESNIFYTTPLYYISHKDRGASPEEKVSNAFKITVSHLDMHFDYLRIYSIQRTSINGTPICKRIQDIELKNLTGIHEDPEDPDSPLYYVASYTDNGTSGDTVDPTELLYKGGESIIAETLEQKDNTLFLGNISVTRDPLNKNLLSTLKATCNLKETTRNIYATEVSTNNYVYDSQLTAFDSADKDNSTPCAGFKFDDYYRLGVQFQYKTGKWSEPFCIGDAEPMTKQPTVDVDGSDNKVIKLPIFTAEVRYDGDLDVAKKLIAAGYKKVRPVVVFPEIKDRKVLCQGVACPTLFTSSHDNERQPSWFFRDGGNTINYRSWNYTTAPSDENSGLAPVGCEIDADPNSHLIQLPYTNKEIEGANAYKPRTYISIGGVNEPIGYIRRVEIEGDYDAENKFNIDKNVCTIHTPDAEFNTDFTHLQFSGSQIRQMGQASIAKTFGDIDIQTETPTISTLGSGFVHKDCVGDNMKGILAGPYYDDVPLDDTEGSGTIHKLNRMKSSAKWIVYPWQSTGSLNNDINRPTNQGTASAILKKKIISNLRISNATVWDDSIPSSGTALNIDPQLFSSDEVAMVKCGDKIYKGNIDTSLVPNHADGKYFVYDDTDFTGTDSDEHITLSGFATTHFNCENIWKTYSKSEDENNSEGLYNFLWRSKTEGSTADTWFRREKEPGETYLDLVIRKRPVRMKYKSTPHIVINTGASSLLTWKKNQIPIVEIIRNADAAFESQLFGGTSVDAFKENTWLPCGEPVRLDKPTTHHPVGGSSYQAVDIKYSYGDTYFQRWDCLKTYAFTREDINQVVEIGSFMLESHVNLDGRYDRNRGQQNNLNMSPINFNLMNDVYSQRDNFFTYKMLDEEDRKNQVYSNQITWSKTKESGADIDLWTNITMASVLEFDGDKGKINKLIRFNDQLLCFQDTGFSQVLYNENTQISTTEGVPIEIANSGKVNGKRYISNSIGCSNKWSMVDTPSGIYFMDNYDKSIFLFNGQLNNISLTGGFNSWCKQVIPDSKVIWKPAEFDSAQGRNCFRTVYDKLNQDVLFINKETALAFSEKFNTFTSFYDYGNAPFFCNLDDTGVWIMKNVNQEYILWKHHGGTYCNFFGAKKPYWMTLVGNPEPQMDKIFTNLEFRACTDIQNEGDHSVPFDYLETWNEYQHGRANIDIKSGHSAMVHHRTDSYEASLKRKFRIWRCDIPRDNAPFYDYPIKEEGETQEAYEQRLADYNAWLNEEKAKNIYRTGKHPTDRMRNPWLYIKLKKNEESIADLHRTEMHDVVLTYFG